MIVATLALLAGLAAGPVRAEPTATARRALDERLSRESAGLATLIRRDFPEDFAVLEFDLLEAHPDGGLDETVLRRETLEMSRTIAARLQGEIGQAPAAPLLILARRHLAALTALRRTSPDTCAALSEGRGPSEVPAGPIDPRAAGALAPLMKAQLEAIVAGRRQPTTHHALTDPEADQVGVMFVRRGGRQDWILNLGDGAPADMTPTQRCEAGIGLARALLAQRRDLIVRYVATN